MVMGSALLRLGQRRLIHISRAGRCEIDRCVHAGVTKIARFSPRKGAGAAVWRPLNRIGAF